MNVEFYEQDNRGINQQAGLRTHGGNGRRFQQKCLKMYAREEYGKKRFKHKFFETIPLNNFKHLVLKPFAASWNQSGVNDHICNQIASQLNIEALASRPVVLYLNGEYWGIYYIHEKPDERYLEDHFGVDIDNVNIINGWNPNADHGSVQNFSALFRWMETADLADADNYAFVSTKIDLDNFIDYQIFELFIENNDWPANNMRCWQEDDGKWRWIFFDGDACLCWMTFNAFDNAVYEGDNFWPSNWRATLFFRKLMENDDFKLQFNTRFHELLGTTFSYEVTKPIFDYIQETIIDEVPFQSDRFGFPRSLDSWDEDMRNVDWFLHHRCEMIQEPLEMLLVGLTEAQQSQFLCYPNPFSGELHICLDAEAFDKDEVAIFDMLGRKVFAMPLQFDNANPTITFNPHLNAGVYVLRIGKLTQRIVRY
jgi:hypothetical protein